MGLVDTLELAHGCGVKARSAAANPCVLHIERITDVFRLPCRRPGLPDQKQNLHHLGKKRILLTNMKTKPTTIILTAGFCILLLLMVVMTGCTGSNSPTATVTTPVPSDTAASAAPSALPSAAPAQTTAGTAAATPVQTTVVATLSQDPVSLTVNSVTRQTKVYTMNPKPDRVFLVLDVTIKNNAVVKGFDLADTSLSLSYAKPGTHPEPSLTSQLRGGLDNPIIMPTTIEQNDKRTGQIVFGVADGSGKYTVNLIGSDGTIMSSAQITA